MVALLMKSVLRAPPWQTGTEIMRQGDTDTEYMYVMESGVCGVFFTDEDKKTKRVNTKTRGMRFGELALLYASARSATVRKTGKRGGKGWRVSAAVSTRERPREVPRKCCGEARDDAPYSLTRVASRGGASSFAAWHPFYLELVASCRGEVDSLDKGLPPLHACRFELRCP